MAVPKTWVVYVTDEVVLVKMKVVADKVAFASAVYILVEVTPLQFFMCVTISTLFL